MLTTIFAAAAMLLTLALPIFPDGLSLPIATFLALCAASGLGGLIRSHDARALLVFILPWVLALVVAVLVGILRGNHMVQAMEDALPYVLFILGLVAGRGAVLPKVILWAILVVAVADGLASLALMQGFDLTSNRSTFNFHKVIAGHLLVGFYAAALLRSLQPARRRLLRGALATAMAVLVVSVIATVSRGMALGLVLGVATAFYLRRPSRGLTIGLVAILVGAIFATTLLQFGESYLRLGSSATVEGRVREIAECLTEFRRMPLFGAGLGAEMVVDGFYVSYVHNMLAYHLWKFGLLGSTLLSLPFWPLTRQAWQAPATLRPTMIGGALSVAVYLVTCASYKNYFLVPMVGLTVGASLTIARQVARRGPSPAP